MFLGVKVQRTYFESHLHVLLPIILPDGQFTYSTEVLSIFVLMFSTRNHPNIPQMYLRYLTPMILLPCRTLVIFAIFRRSSLLSGRDKRWVGAVIVCAVPRIYRV